MLIDLIVIFVSAFLLVLLAVIGLHIHITKRETFIFGTVIFMYFFQIVYFTWTTARYGQSPGKMLAGIKIVAADGGPLSGGRSLGRTFAYQASQLTFMIGFLMAGFMEQKKALHDLIAGTRVVYLPEVGRARKAIMAVLGVSFACGAVFINTRNVIKNYSARIKESVAEGSAPSGQEVSSPGLRSSGDLLVAAQQGDLAKARSLLSGGADVDAKDRDGFTALMFAAHAGHSDVAQALIRAKADVNARESSTGGTALTLAAVRGHVDVVQSLIRAGADVNAKTTDGRSALMLAALGGHADAAQTLIQAGADVNAKTTDGETALSFAALNGHADAARGLIRAGADVGVKGGHGETALFTAAAAGHADVAQVLIQAGADVNAKHVEGWTPLMMATTGGYADVVQALLQAGADVNARNREGRTARELVCTRVTASGYFFPNCPKAAILDLLSGRGGALGSSGSAADSKKMETVVAIGNSGWRVVPPSGFQLDPQEHEGSVRRWTRTWSLKYKMNGEGEVIPVTEGISIGWPSTDQGRGGPNERDVFTIKNWLAYTFRNVIASPNDVFGPVQSEPPNHGRPAVSVWYKSKPEARYVNSYYIYEHFVFYDPQGRHAIRVGFDCAAHEAHVPVNLLFQDPFGWKAYAAMKGTIAPIDPAKDKVSPDSSRDGRMSPEPGKALDEKSAPLLR